MTTTRNALKAGVLESWRRHYTMPINLDQADRQASLAVAEVLDALRANPSWAESLGIGQPDQHRRRRDT